VVAGAAFGRFDGNRICVAENSCCDRKLDRYSRDPNFTQLDARQTMMNDLLSYQRLLDEFMPLPGQAPEGYSLDAFGTLTDLRFLSKLGLPDDSDDKKVLGLGDGSNGERWFEAVNWIAAARAARDRYVMVTLGACYGAQAVGAYRTLQWVNPLPCKLVAVEAEPDNFRNMSRFFRDNGIDPDAHWLVPLAVSDTNNPVFFPVGGPGVGSNNCFSTNETAARRVYADTLIAAGRTEGALRSLLLHNTTGLTKDLVPGHDVKGEIKLVSSITLKELLGPFDCVDYVESDIQQSEILVFPPYIDLLRRKVRRIHIGTHGGDVHAALHKLFADDGWEIVFSYPPNARHDSALGSFETNDGVLTVRNPQL
jgi:hypothetical protein